MPCAGTWRTELSGGDTSARGVSTAFRSRKSSISSRCAVTWNVTVRRESVAVFSSVCEGYCPIFAAETVAHWVKGSLCRENWDSPPVNGYPWNKCRICETMPDVKRPTVDLKRILAGAQLPALPQSAIRLLELSQDARNGPAGTTWRATSARRASPSGRWRFLE